MVASPFITVIETWNASHVAEAAARHVEGHVAGIERLAGSASPGLPGLILAPPATVVVASRASRHGGHSVFGPTATRRGATRRGAGIPIFFGPALGVARLPLPKLVLDGGLMAERIEKAARMLGHVADEPHTALG